MPPLGGGPLAARATCPFDAGRLQQQTIYDVVRGIGSRRAYASRVSTFTPCSLGVLSRRGQGNRRSVQRPSRRRIDIQTLNSDCDVQDVARPSMHASRRSRPRSELDAVAAKLFDLNHGMTAGVAVGR
jgi:hypothetical protein